MAMAPSPEISPVMGTSSRADRNHSQTPPTAQPLSKRDKRRTQLVERLQEVTSSFSANKDQQYRQQLQAIQVDTNLILRADPYSETPLADRGGDIYDLIHNAGNAQSLLALNNGDIAGIAGRTYSDFANDVLDACEKRDSDLTRHEEKYNRSVLRLNISNAFMIKLADEEHKSLSTTLRDRLINSITGKKSRLLKEKDELFNIAESNAIHLHPNQFSIANPASPGGLHTKRSTRQRRDVDDIPSFTDSHKRKRKAVDDTGSPIPSKRLMENGFSTPIWTTEQVSKAINKGTGSPAYSVERLFTDKELTMAYNYAAQASNEYILLHKPQNEDQSSPNGNADSNSQDGENTGEPDADIDGAESGLSSAPMMERQYSHATRSTRTALTHNVTSTHGVEALTELSLPGNFQIFSSTLPKIPSQTLPKGDKSKDENSPFRVTNEELYNDLQRIEHCKRINIESGDRGRSLFVKNNDRELLRAAVAEPGQYQGWITRDQSKRSKQVDDGWGGIPMSKQSSMNEMGGVPMSRQNTNDGGSTMGRRRGRQ